MKLYLDTSVLGGYFDREFAKDTGMLFEYIIEDNIEVIYSEILNKELEKAPERVRKVLDKLPNIDYVSPNEEAISLARMYIQEGPLGEKSSGDAHHIAIATVERATEIVSWNFRHMVNFLKIRQYNTINLREGYGLINIHSPSDVIRIIDEQKANNYDS